MGFSENLQILRKMKNMSQEQLAERLDVSRQAVSKWESGNGYPETEKLISICEIFDCSMDYIMGLSPVRRIMTDSNSTKDETQKEYLLNCFRRLGSKNKARLIAYADGLLDAQKE